jgi:hypothetical protein
VPLGVRQLEQLALGDMPYDSGAAADVFALTITKSRSNQ